MNNQLPDSPRLSPSVSDLYPKLTELIQTQTRFDTVQSRVESATVVKQTLSVTVTHSLAGEVKHIAITGKSSHGYAKSDINPQSRARSALYPLIKDATTRGVRYLQSPQAHYKAEGIVLHGPAGDSYYDLDRCTECRGDGQKSCPRCAGQRTMICSSCAGMGRTKCLSCYGSSRCLSCNGGGSKSEYQTKYVTVQVWNGQQYETQTVSQLAAVPVSCTSCYGTGRCQSCNGMGTARCMMCSGQRTIPCPVCNGHGSLMCSACAGSGSVGELFWVEIDHKADYAMTWNEPVDASINSFPNAQDLHKIAEDCESLVLASIKTEESLPASSIQATYAGMLEIEHLNVVVDNKTYHVGAYGKSRQWYGVDGLLSDVLVHDLEALRDAVVGDKGTLKKPSDRLSDALRKMASSAINWKLIDAHSSKTPNHEANALVTPAYREKLTSASLAAFDQIYTGASTRTWWPIPLVAGLAAGWMWWLDNALASILLAALSLPLSILHLHLAVRSEFIKALGDKPKAEQAIRMTKNAGRHHVAQALSAIGAILVITAVLYGISHPHHQYAIPAPVVSLAVPVKAAAPSSDSAQTHKPKQTTQTRGVIAQVQSAQLAQAISMVDRNQGFLARPILQQLAQEGVTKAYLPLAKVLMYDAQGTTQNFSQINRSAARKWANKAVAIFPDDPEALGVAGELAASGVQIKPDMKTGVALLERAAAKGNRDSMKYLGLIFVNGANVPRNPKKALHWFTLAANAGVPDAMYDLGLMYWQGDGMAAPNRQLARKWWAQAADLGEERAKRKLTEIGAAR